jgi:hypothetical protein
VLRWGLQRASSPICAGPDASAGSRYPGPSVGHHSASPLASVGLPHTRCEPAAPGTAVAAALRCRPSTPGWELVSVPGGGQPPLPDIGRKLPGWARDMAGKSHANANADAVPVGLFWFGVVLCTALGSVLAVGVVRRAPGHTDLRPGRTRADHGLVRAPACSEPHDYVGQALARRWSCTGSSDRHAGPDAGDPESAATSLAVARG